MKTINEFLNEKGLGFIPAIEPVFLSNGSPVEGYQRIFNPDNPMSTFAITKPGYTPVAHSEAFAIAEPLLNDGLGTISRIKSYHDGSYAMVHIRLSGGEHEVRRGDPVVKEIVISNGIDYIHGVRAWFNVERLVCTNGLVAISRDNSRNIRHTPTVYERIVDASVIYRQAIQWFDDFYEKINLLANKPMSDAIMAQVRRQIVKDKDSTRAINQWNKILDLFEHGKGNNGQTCWDMYNGITEWTDHFAGRPGTHELAALEGVNGRLKDDVFELLLKAA